jgi:CRISPR-associated protein Csx17
MINTNDLNVTIPLEGCRPQPLMSYLKALGVLRVITLQKDPDARGAWVDGRFVLSTKLDKAGLSQFLLEEYQPTPITSPWNGGSGYYPVANPQETLIQLRDSQEPRLEPYRRAITSAFELIESMGLKEKPTDEKKQMLQRLRIRMPECFLPWMDAAVVILSDSQSFPPLLGSGGNDGRLEFSLNFMNRLVQLGFLDSKLNPSAKEFLQNTLFGTPCGGLGKSAVGQFNPGRAGGPNSTQGFEGDALDNPWDFILMMEGVVLFTGTAASKLAAQNFSVSRFPFIVKTIAAEASVESKDAQEAKGELWLPLWSAAASLAEISYLLNEGRADIGEKSARSGVDFAQAIASLGVDRGIDAFQRMGFLIRNGLSVLVTPLGQFPVREQKDIDLIRQLDSWLYPLRSIVAEGKAPVRFSTALRGWDSAVMAYCRQGGSARFSDLIASLGDIFRSLSKSPKYREGFRGLPKLTLDWLDAGNDQTPEFRLARCLAGIYDSTKKIGPFAVHVLPLEAPNGFLEWADKTPLDCVWTSGSLAQNLALVIRRRLIDADRKNLQILPFATVYPAKLDDVMLFLSGRTDDTRLERLMLGMLCIRQEWEKPNQERPDWNSIPFAFSLIRPLFASMNFEFHGVQVPSKPQSSLLASLLAGDLSRALDLGARRIRNLGLVPLGSSRTGKHTPLSDVSGVDPIRLAASCLFGLSIWDLNGLLNRVVRVSNEQAEIV